MTDWANLVVGCFISGRVFFIATAMCLVGCALNRWSSGAPPRFVSRVFVLLGVVLVILSAAPLPYWMYGLLFALLAAVWFRVGQSWSRFRWIRFLPPVLLVAQSALMVWSEISHSLPPAIRLPKANFLFVVGDSLSLGADAPGQNWPDVLGGLAGLKVRSFAFGGAKVATALDEVLRIKEEEALVILEIGGNDLLSGTSIRKFQQDLDQMLTFVCRPNRRVVMLELPLPPLHNRYGMVQRALARNHGVTLVPKRYLADILVTSGATVDGLHLSNAGHELLGRTLFNLLDPKPHPSK